MSPRSEPLEKVEYSNIAASIWQAQPFPHENSEVTHLSSDRCRASSTTSPAEVQPGLPADHRIVCASCHVAQSSENSTLKKGDTEVGWLASSQSLGHAELISCL